MWRIEATDVDDLATGASLFSTGGGGDVRLLSALLKRTLTERGPVPVVGFDELPPDAHVVPVAGAGSYTLFEEKPMAGDELIRAVDKIALHTGVRVDAIACDAAAGVMLLFPVLAAAQLGLPLVDADSARRGVPRMDQSLLTFAGLQIAPLAVSDGGGGTLIIDGLDNEGTERAMRAMLAAIGGWACYAMRPLSVAECVRGMAPGSVRAAVELGAMSRRGEEEALAAKYGLRTLFHGKVTEVRRQPMVGMAAGSAATAVIEHADGSGRVLRVEMQSEYLLAIEDGEVTACVPDLVCVVEHGAARCLPTERLRYGLWVRVLAMPCLPEWRSPAGLELLGPRAFGYDFDYVPLAAGPEAGGPEGAGPEGAGAGEASSPAAPSATFDTSDMSVSSASSAAPAPSDSAAGAVGHHGRDRGDPRGRGDASDGRATRLPRG